MLLRQVKIPILTASIVLTQHEQRASELGPDSYVELIPLYDSIRLTPSQLLGNSKLEMLLSP